MFLVLAYALLLLHVQAIESTFGSKSPYNHSNIPSNNDNCEIRSIFYVLRHGSRYPTLKHIRRYEKLHKHLIHQNWTHPFTELDEGLLTPNGEREMRQIGKRFRERYASLFAKNPNYHPRIYEFKASSSPRTLQSAHAFAFGMFGSEKSIVVETTKLTEDHHLRFHDMCGLYQKTKKADTPKLDSILNKVMNQVKSRIGGSQQTDFSIKDMEALWSACMFETSVFALRDKSCKYFTLEEAKLLEYVQDVYDYWEKGFGKSINYEMSCKLFEDMIQSLDQSRFRFLFGHAETIMPIVSFLEFYKDDIHLGHSYPYDFEKRKWRSGVISPFAANIGFILKSCEKGQDLIVEIVHNEIVMDISHLCDHTKMMDKFSCPFQEFKRAILSRIGACEFHSLCGES